MGFERYVDYALDVPMYFVKRGDTLHRRRRPVVPRPDGRQAARPAGRARHASPTGRTTSRRSSPRCGSSAISKCAAPTAARGARLPALPAFWVGLLYDDALPRCRLGPGQGLDRRGAPEAARRRARSSGFAATIRGRDVLELAEANASRWRAPGLKRRNRLDRRRPRRDALSRAARRVRRARPHPGRGTAGEIPRPVGRLGRAGLRRNTRCR